MTPTLEVKLVIPRLNVWIWRKNDSDMPNQSRFSSALSAGSIVRGGGGGGGVVRVSLPAVPGVTVSLPVIQPGQSLLQPARPVQPGQSLLLSEPMRKKMKY